MPRVLGSEIFSDHAMESSNSSAEFASPWSYTIFSFQFFVVEAKTMIVFFFICDWGSGAGEHGMPFELLVQG